MLAHHFLREAEEEIKLHNQQDIDMLAHHCLQDHGQDSWCEQSELAETPDGLILSARKFVREQCG